MNLTDPLFLNPQAVLTILIAIFLYAISWNSTIRRATLVFFSIYFYFKFAGLMELGIVISLCLITFFCGLSKRSKFILIAIGVNLVTLVIAKIQLASFNTSTWIPLGISFFVFEFIHYLVEIKRGMEPEREFQQFLTFSFFFPTVVSGPIRRYREFTDQTATLKRITSDNLLLGLSLISLGYIYKFGADQFANFQDKMNYYGVYSGVLGGIIFLFVISMRIFLDFAGYSYIAIGIARIVGIRIPQNFNAPYLSTSIIEFWNRWHISLSNWVRDYLFIPLGGSRVRFIRNVVNLMISMAVIGLWHGFGTRFLVWGLLQGLGLSVNHAFRRLTKGRADSRKTTFRLLVSWIFTMLFVSCSWVFFFYEPDKALTIMRSILFETLPPEASNYIRTLLNRVLP
jgi:alginate O-acetyltransferase complex protein AlgI